MTEQHHTFCSLNVKILYSVLISLAIALAMFFCITGLGRLALAKLYMGPNAVSSRKARIYSDLNTYVSEEKIRGNDSAALARWTGENKFITILIYNKNGDLIMRASEGQVQSSYSMQTYERMQYAVEYGKLYPMRFADGVYHVAIGDYTHKKEMGINMVISSIIAIICFFSVMFWYIRTITDRIIRLSKEAVVIGGGELEAAISVEGNDEISALAKEVDNMRNSVIERMGNEKKAWEANSELITAISHDIRTPMTSLIGYLELLNGNDFTDRDKSRQFCTSAYAKAAELKELTDELFKYFLVFGRTDLEMNIEVFDAGLLLEQLLGEAAYALMDSGFKIKQLGFEGSCEIKADPLYLKRVVDNLISNVKKYADREKPVVFLTEYTNGWLSVCISNTISKSLNKVESTRIGIRTCEKIMQHMSGTFKVTKDDEHFAAEFSIPVENGK